MRRFAHVDDRIPFPERRLRRRIADHNSSQPWFALALAIFGPALVALLVVIAVAAARNAAVPASIPMEYPADFGVRRIMIDAGHGGTNEGTKTFWGRLEKDRNLELALGLAAHLRRSAHWEVLLTRDTDAELPNSQRPEIANAAGVDRYISLHGNGALDDREGFGVIWYSAQNNPKSEPLARAIARALTDAGFHGDFSMGPRFTEPRGPDAPPEFTYQRTDDELPVYVRERIDHRMIWPATMPAVLIETHYMTNPIEAVQFGFDRTRERLFAAIERGLVDAITTEAETVE